MTVTCGSSWAVAGLLDGPVDESAAHAKFVEVAAVK
jgi:hypothetical protein